MVNASVEAALILQVTTLQQEVLKSLCIFADWSGQMSRVARFEVCGFPSDPLWWLGGVRAQAGASHGCFSRLPQVFDLEGSKGTRGETWRCGLAQFVFQVILKVLYEAEIMARRTPGHFHWTPQLCI